MIENIIKKLKIGISLLSLSFGILSIFFLLSILLFLFIGINIFGKFVLVKGILNFLFSALISITSGIITLILIRKKNIVLAKQFSIVGIITSAVYLILSFLVFIFLMNIQLPD